MPVRDEKTTRFMDEIRIISPWAYFFAALAFAGVIAVLMFAAHADKKAPPPAVMVLLAIVTGTLLACYVVVIGYVNRDAGRRGMSRFFWTLLAIFIPTRSGSSCISSCESRAYRTVRNAVRLSNPVLAFVLDAGIA